MKHQSKTWTAGLMVLLAVILAGAVQPAPIRAQDGPEFTAEPGSSAITVTLDKTVLNNGGEITISGTAPAGKPVFIEVWAEETVKASLFDSKIDKKTGKRPYILYMSQEIPAYYKIFMPTDRGDALEAIKKQGKDWSFSKALKETGAAALYSAPGKIAIDRYQATLMGSIVGSRGDLLSPMNETDTIQKSMQLIKARFLSPEKVMGADVNVSPDGAFTARINIRSGLAPGKYMVVAGVNQNLKSAPTSFENTITFPNLYLSNAGTSLNLLWPFFLTLAISIFGVLMGAGGGFILNPILVSIFPLPHTIVAGTVMPTVLFSQTSGIYNYSKIRFINWKLGVSIGLAMLVGGFIGPKLTELITLSQFKFVFGWILVILAGLMFWQTTPGYLKKNQKEQAILKEFKKKAEEAAKAKSRA